MDIAVYLKHLDRLEPDERERLIASLTPAPDYDYVDDDDKPRLVFRDPQDESGTASLIRAQTIVLGLSQKLGIDDGAVTVDLEAN